MSVGIMSIPPMTFGYVFLSNFHWPNVYQCQAVSQVSVLQMSVGQMSVGVCLLRKYLSAKCLSAKYLSAQFHLAHCLLIKGLLSN
jgi:hypothetical protein